MLVLGVRMPITHIRVPGFNPGSWLHFLGADGHLWWLKQWVSAIHMEHQNEQLQTFNFSCRHLRSEPTSKTFSIFSFLLNLSFSLSLLCFSFLPPFILSFFSLSLPFFQCFFPSVSFLHPFSLCTFSFLFLPFLLSLYPSFLSFFIFSFLFILSHSFHLTFFPLSLFLSLFINK